MDQKPLSEAMKEFETNEKKEVSTEDAIKIAGADFMKLRASKNTGDASKMLNTLRKKHAEMPENEFKKKALLGLDNGSWNPDKVYKNWFKANADKIFKAQAKEANAKLDGLKIQFEEMLKSAGFENVKIKSTFKADKKGVSGKVEISL